MRCERHDLACGPDGVCVLCRRAGEPRRLPVALGIVAGVCLCAAVAGATVYRLRSERRAVESVAPTAAGPLAADAVESDGDRVASAAQPAPFARAASPTGDPMQEEQSRRLRALAARPGTMGPNAALPDVPAVAADPAPSPAVAATSHEARAASDRLPNVHVVVYTTSWCPVCRRAKQWMSAHGVAYEEHDVEASSDSARRMRAINPRGGVPTFDVEGQVEVGFSAGDLTAAIQRAAVRRGI